MYNDRTYTLNYRVAIRYKSLTYKRKVKLAYVYLCHRKRNLSTKIQYNYLFNVPIYCGGLGDYCWLRRTFSSNTELKYFLTTSSQSRAEKRKLDGKSARVLSGSLHFENKALDKKTSRCVSLTTLTFWRTSDIHNRMLCYVWVALLHHTIEAGFLLPQSLLYSAIARLRLLVIYDVPFSNSCSILTTKCFLFAYLVPKSLIFYKTQPFS